MSERTPRRSRISGSVESGHNVGPAACVSALLGATAAMAISGLATRFHALFGKSAFGGSDEAVTGAVVGAALIALAIGVRLPQRFAVWVCALAWRRFISRGSAGDGSDISSVLLNPVAADRPLYWVVLSVIALTAGIMTALLPPSVRLAAAAYHWMHAQFIWSAGPLAVLQTAIVFLSALVPLAILGLAVSCAHHLSCPYGRWETKATGWLLIGASAGTLISTWITSAGGGARRSDLMLIVAALPVLMVSLVSAAASSSHAAGSRQSAETVDVPLPTWSDRWPTLLRASIVAVGGGGGWAVSVWARYFGETAAAAPMRIGLTAATMLLAGGLGVLAGCRAKRSGLRSIGGFGVACAAAGVIAAASTIGLIDLPSADAGTPSAPGGWGTLPALRGWGTLSLACGSLMAIGFATAYGRQTLLSRVASRSAAGATILARMLVCAALTVWIGAPVAERLVGRMATLMMLALSLLALGGTLILHEPGRSRRTRRARLCAIFASIGAIAAASLHARL